MKYQVLGFLLAVAPAVLALPFSENEAAPSGLFRRQNEIVCCGGRCGVKVGPNDGNPSDEWLHKQVTETLDCGGGGSGCSVSRLTSHTIGWTATGGGNVPWASLGFSWSESTTTGASYTCTADPGQAVCVWARVKHLALDMETELKDYDTCDLQPGEYRATAPTGDVDYYCVHGSACRSDGDQYWCDRQDPDSIPVSI